MVEAGLSAAVVLTEIKDRQLKPFTLQDSKGGTISGTIPLNSRPVLSAGGFQVHARQPFHLGSERLSIGPEAAYGLSWGPSYSGMSWSLVADTAVNFLNGNARISAKLGYGGYKVESDSTFPETRHGFKLGLEGAMRLLADLDFVSQVGVTLTPDGPQTIATFGFQWLFNRRSEPPVDLDGSLGRQSVTAALQLLDRLDRMYYVPNAMAEVSVGGTLSDRLQTLMGITSAYINNDVFATLPPIDQELAKVLVALDSASNNGMRAAMLYPYRVRMRDFKEKRHMEVLKLGREFLEEIEQRQCHKAAELAESRDPEAAGKILEKCIENLTVIGRLFATLEPVLPPIGKVDVAGLQRKTVCLLKAEGCTIDIDPGKTVPAVQKRLKAAGGGVDADGATGKKPR